MRLQISIRWSAAGLVVALAARVGLCDNYLFPSAGSRSPLNLTVQDGSPPLPAGPPASPGAAAAAGTGYGANHFGSSPAAAQAYWDNARTAQTQAGSPYDRIQYNTGPQTIAAPVPPGPSMYGYGQGTPPTGRSNAFPAGSASSAPLPTPNGTDPESLYAPLAAPNSSVQMGAADAANEVLAIPCLPSAMPNYGPCGSMAADGQPTCYAGSKPPYQRVGFFFNWDLLYASIDSASSDRFGIPAPGSVLNQAVPFDSFESLGGNLINEYPEFSDRLEFGFNDRWGSGNGWLVSILLINQDKQASLSGGVIDFDDPLGLLLGFPDADFDGFADDGNGNNIFGNSGQDTNFDGIPDTPAPQDDGDLITFLPVFSDIAISVRTELEGFEVMKSNALTGDDLGGFFWLGGVRFLDVKERVQINATGSFVNYVNDATVENFIFGPQVGIGYGWAVGAWRLDGSFRFLAGVNRQRRTQSGSLTAISGGGLNEPLNLNTSSSLDRTAEDTQFSPVLEWRLGSAYYLGRFVAWRFGYTAWYAGGLTRPSSGDYTLPPAAINLGNDDNIFAYSFTTGLELSF